ncbi:helix-hairpin-helix domain-containing protein [Neobacillus ginsengisoli]|uniref:Competence protein ComEA n=1 Tax=Neobacillus ginsengisoli TaxID=904295 RepID=A0ABT9XNU3_9BACI|nr:helix-hairpin-helix domain-containing protein [Neobacillus ginsengisoli]MDQ0197227.1 competence protein ComEA [Neobacillus ginsengisoli]
MKDWLIEHKYYALFAVMIALGGIYYFYNTGNESSRNTTISEVGNKLQSDVKVAENKNKKTELSQSQHDKQTNKIMVDVKGEIKQPGVYESTKGERVIDVINRAGGVTDKADKSQINFAEHVQDEMVIYIPAKGEAGAAGTWAGSASSATIGGSLSNKQSKIDLNKADVNELQNLPGVGPSKAASIIEYREKSGPFKTIEDLKNISGIGDKTFEKLKDLIVVH